MRGGCLGKSFMFHGTFGRYFGPKGFFLGGEGYERTNGEDEKGSEESFCDGLSFRWKKEM